ncbi:MAG: prolipoprotein diacylglyceryl transferase, partial [Bacteroidales bacterium]|nr:prolipoprotein diacylglyceryl transferase [Bacteroidales bacterium]
MEIMVSDQELFFNGFYVLSFTVTFLIVIVFCLKEKIPLGSVLLMLTAVALLTVIGSRLITIPSYEWRSFFNNPSDESFQDRNSIGGLLAGLAGFIISVRILRIDSRIITLYAWVVPAGFGIQKLGCLFNGCCYGTVTGLPWGIRYPVGTNAHFFQWSHGFIPVNEALSLPVHPVQLYQAIGLFAVAFFVWKSRNLWKRDFSIILFSLILFTLLRFITEFFRDPSSSGFLTGIFLNMKALQWVLLVVCFILSGILLVAEKLPHANKSRIRQAEPSFAVTIAFALVVSTLFSISRNIFTPFEMVSVDLRLLPAVMVLAVSILKTIPVPRIRLATLVFLLFPLFVVAQTLPQAQDTLVPSKSINGLSRHDIESYMKIDFGISSGSYLSDLAYNPQEGTCGTYYTHEDYQHRFRVAAMGITKVEFSERMITTYGLNTFAGVNREYN